MFINPFIPFEFGYIGQPFLVWFFCLKVSVKYVLCNVLWIGGLPRTTMICILYRRFYLQYPADTQNSLIVNGYTIIPIQIVPDSPISFIWMLFMYGLN